MKDICENSHLISEENNQWGMPLVFSYNQGFGYTYNDDDRMCMLLPPSLNEEKPQIMGAELEVMFINAASQNQEAAKRYLP